MPHPRLTPATPRTAPSKKRLHRPSLTPTAPRHAFWQVAVSLLDKLPSVIDAGITAVRNGELDQQLAEVTKQATAPKRKKAGGRQIELFGISQMRTDVDLRHRADTQATFQQAERSFVLPRGLRYAIIHAGGTSRVVVTFIDGISERDGANASKHAQQFGQCQTCRMSPSSLYSVLTGAISSSPQ